MRPLILYAMFVCFSFHKKNITRESEQWNNEREKRRGGGGIIFSVIRVRDSAFITAEAFNTVAIQQINIYSKEPIIAQGQLS